MRWRLRACTGGLGLSMRMPERIASSQTRAMLSPLAEERHVMQQTSTKETQRRFMKLTQYRRCPPGSQPMLSVRTSKTSRKLQELQVNFRTSTSEPQIGPDRMVPDGDVAADVRACHYPHVCTTNLSRDNAEEHQTHDLSGGRARTSTPAGWPVYRSVRHCLGEVFCFRGLGGQSHHENKKHCVREDLAPYKQATPAGV